MSKRYGGWIYLFCFLLISGFAQQNGPAGRSEPPASVPPGSGNHQMTLDVVVLDKSGKAVSGLQEAEFALQDNKQPRKIASFQAVEGKTATADPPVQVVLLVDEINAAFTNIATERLEIEKFLRRSGGTLAQPVSVVFLTDTTASGTTPSSDANAVIAEMNKKQDALRMVGGAQGTHGGDERIRLSINALKQFADYEAATPGRKLVIWISPGWPFLTTGLDQQMATKRQKQGFFDSLVALSEGLREARITLYNIDPLGASDAGDLRTSEYKQFAKGVKTARDAELGHLALQALAYQSGGRVLNSSNDLAGEIATCVADASAFYILTFDGVAGDGPNEYHALEVKIAKPGLTARTRAGYYAQLEHGQQR